MHRKNRKLIDLRFFIVFFLLPISVFAQQRITGSVQDAESLERLPYVSVINLTTNTWVLTDEEGDFSIGVGELKRVELQFQLLGKKTITRWFDTKNSLNDITISLADENLRLEEVVVKATKGHTFSEVLFEEEAINQVQAFSLNEVLEQLPGQQISNFSLNEFKPIAFRTVRPNTVSDDGFGNKSFGTAVVVDDIPLSNNENMQSYTANMASPFAANYLGFGDNRAGTGFNGTFSNANFGVDLRQIATQNIEKIEVVQGIPSVKYGDLTSGLIKIDQKAGRSPYLAYASLREGTTEYGVNKGLKLPSGLGFLNVSTSFLDAQANPREAYTNYRRVNSQLMWSWANKEKNIKNSLSLQYGFHLDDVNYDKEERSEKKVKNEQKDWRLTNRFSYHFKPKAFLDYFDFNVNFNFSSQYSFESKAVNNGGKLVGFGTREGVYEGVYTAPRYTSIKEVEGKPLSLYAAGLVYKSISNLNSTHNLSAGFNYRLSDNLGAGRLGSPETSISQFTNQTGSGSSAFRPYNYANQVQAESQISLFLEDDFTRFYKDKTLRITAGLRADLQNEYLSLSPRVNSALIFNKIKLRAGLGLTAKAPSLNQIYTGYRYYDVVLADFRYPGVYNIGAIQTFVERENNPDVKPSRSLRTELGADYKFGFATLNITAFYNKLFQGISSQSYPVRRDLAEVAIDDSDLQNPELQITGYRPYYYTESQIANVFESEDYGVETFLNFPSLVFKQLSFGLQASYVRTQDFPGNDRFVKSSDASTPIQFGLYKRGIINREKLNLGENLSYHIPQIGLLINVRSEHILIDNYQRGASLYPYAYIDSQLNKVSILPSEQSNTDLFGDIIKSDAGYVQPQTEVYHNYHLRISKDFLNGFRFSFYVNNFLDLKPTRLVMENGQMVKRSNPDVVQLSFGTKIEYQF